MRKLWLLCALAVAAGSGSMAQPPLGAFFTSFTGATMRVDYYHTGGPRGEGREVLTLDRIVADGEWPGSQTRLEDDTGLGNYLLEVLDRDTGRLIYSRGFASVYGEWETTAEFRTAARTFHESLRFPWPKAAVRVVVKKRDAQNAFRELWATVVDPASRQANRADRRPGGAVWTLFENGRPADKVDVLLISEGYTAAQLPKFHADAERLVEALFSYEPFKDRKSDFNVRGLDLPSDEPGVTRPRAGVFRRTPLSVEYNIFDLERYMLTYDNRALREAASAAPYDVIEILVNEEEYGGGGIFNLLGTVAAGNPRGDYIFVHEFGHNLAGLGDEYIGNVTYETGAAAKAEPWEPNLTALRDPAALKWRDLVERGTPIPTPKSFAGKVGAFEGGGYETRGIYRPEDECIMGSTRPVGFCRVCQRAISRVIDTYSRP